MTASLFLLLPISLLLVVLIGAFFWWAALDAAAPADADGVVDIAAYRALVADDAPETLPTAVNVEFVGESKAPSFAVESGAFDGQRTLSYNSFQIVAPSGQVWAHSAAPHAVRMRVQLAKHQQRVALVLSKRAAVFDDLRPSSLTEDFDQFTGPRLS